MALQWLVQRLQPQQKYMQSANIQMQSRDIQEEEIRMSINFLYVEGTSEKLWHILRSHKIRSTFYTENTLHKLLCKPKVWVVAEDKNNIIYEFDVVTVKQSTLVYLNSL